MAALYEAISDATSTSVGQYVVPFANNIRFYMQMNAREAMHVIELRTAEDGLYPIVTHAFNFVGRGALGAGALPAAGGGLRGTPRREAAGSRGGHARGALGAARPLR